MRNDIALATMVWGLGGCFDPQAPALTDDGSTTSPTGSESTDAPSDPTGGMTMDGATMDGSSETGLGPCQPNPCQNGGTCSDAAGMAMCECPDGFSGELCEVPSADPCRPNPCDNGGTCSVEGDGFTCECADGWEGDTCAEEINECATAPCLNGGACNDEVGGFTCDCVAGFEGELCETNIDDCAPNPCANGQPCIDGIDSFMCDCGNGFEGELCECTLSPLAQVDYTSLGTFQAPMLYNGAAGVTVTGSWLINVLNLNGLGIVGGAFDNTIDGNEWIQFEFDSPSATTRYFVSSAGNQNGDGMVGAATVEAFDEMGASMGVIPVSGAGQFDLDALFGTGDRISRFVVTANVDNHRISSVSVQPIACM